MAASPVPEPSAWEFLLSHHISDRYNRTLPVPMGSRTVRLCARCTGQLLGVLAWVVVFLACVTYHFALFAIEVQWVAAVFPLLASWDWITQTLGQRESTNPLRVASGALLGFSLVDLLGLLLTVHLTIFAVLVLIDVVHIAALVAVLRVSGAWRRVLAEHFPGIDLGPAG